jgi:hypothetical protein
MDEKNFRFERIPDWHDLMVYGIRGLKTIKSRGDSAREVEAGTRDGGCDRVGAENYGRGSAGCGCDRQRDSACDAGGVLQDQTWAEEV